MNNLVQFRTKYGMHVREDPSTKSRIVGILPQQTTFSGKDIVEDEDEIYEWIEIDSSTIDINTNKKVVYVAHKLKGSEEPYLDVLVMVVETAVDKSADAVYNDGFDPPIGTARERIGAKVWPGHWVDVNPIGRYYYLRTDSQGRERHAYHTGADLNLNKPHWDADRGRPVYAIASGVVTAASFYPHWANIVVIKHDPCPDTGIVVSSRYAHLGRLDVRVGERVARSDKLGIVGRDAYNGPYHLHFDISHSNVITTHPTHWPGERQSEVLTNYLDPRKWIDDNRPKR